MPDRKLEYLGRLSDDERFFAGSVYDKLYAARDRYRTGFTFFLSERQSELAKKIMASERYENYMMFGGYEQAERVMLGIFAEYEMPHRESFPLKALTISYRTADKLSHRDFLGALMGLDITRETVGDICAGNGRCVIFLTETAAREAVTLTKIGKTGVKIREGFDLEDIPEREYQLISGTVSSLRIDSVIAAAVKCPRSLAALLVEGGKVSVRGCETTSCASHIGEGDTLTVRGYGKFRLVRIGRTTKKDRTFIEIYKYK